MNTSLEEIVSPSTPYHINTCTSLLTHWITALVSNRCLHPTGMPTCKQMEEIDMRLCYTERIFVCFTVPNIQLNSDYHNYKHEVLLDSNKSQTTQGTKWHTFFLRCGKLNGCAHYSLVNITLNSVYMYQIINFTAFSPLTRVTHHRPLNNIDILSWGYQHFGRM